MVFDGHNAGDKNVGKTPPPSGENNLNGGDLLREHKTVVGKAGDQQVAGLNKVEVGETPTARPPVDAHAVRAEIASVAGTDLTGTPTQVDARLQTQRDQHLADGMAKIQSASTPEQCLALLGTVNEQSSALQDRIAHLTRLSASMSA